jgi:hypothetical protein
MPSLAQGASVTGTFGTADSATITTRGNARFECPTGTTIAEFSGTRVFGPYTGQSYRITAVAGGCDYELLDGSGPIATVTADTQTGALYANGSLVSGARTLSATGMAMVLPSSGSVAANGALTLATSLPLSGGYSWGCYMYFPAGAVYSGSVAGLYYVEMSSNNAGTIYDNRYTGGTPNIPGTKTPIVAAGPGAYTQTTSPVDLVAVTVPANSMGVNGLLRHEPAFAYPNNANNKVLSTVLGSSNIYAKTRTTATQDAPQIDIRNRGIATRQLSTWANAGLPNVASTSGYVNTAQDTTVDLSLITRGQLAVATDYIIVESNFVEVRPFP